MALPDRPLRREPYPHEVTAATDFAALDVAYEETAERLHRLFLDEWLPEQTEALAEQIRAAGSAEDLAAIQAPMLGADEMAEELTTVAFQGGREAAHELTVQNLRVSVPDNDALRALVADHAAAVALQVADGVSLAASRRAVQLYGERTMEQVAEETVEYLNGMAHAWERDQLSGAVGQALNAGRAEVFAEVEERVTIFASELLDAATCEACAEVDGTEYASLSDALRDYPGGGFQGCAGGPRCRGTLIAVGRES